MAHNTKALAHDSKVTPSYTQQHFLAVDEEGFVLST